jgi:hypothetical protein
MRPLLVLVLLAAPALAQDVTIGSKPDETVEASVVGFAAELKSRSHFGFGEHGSREGELAFKNDLDFPGTLPVLGLQGALNFGVFGWAGGEVLGFEDRGEDSQLERLRQESQVTLSPGDLMTANARVVYGGLHYGYEIRVKLFDFLDLAASPTFGFGFFTLDAYVKRVFPTPTTDLGGNAASFVLTPGARLQVEAFDVARIGCDLETGLTGLRFAVSTPHVDLWERVRVYLGVTFFNIDLTVGWRLAATHIEGDGKAVDLRLRGIDASFGVRF